MSRVRGDELKATGLPKGAAFGVAMNLLPRAVKHLGREQALADIRRVVADPSAHTANPYFGPLAERLVSLAAVAGRRFEERESPAPYASWCDEDIDANAVGQMDIAMRLPSAVSGALMPDAHLGYGLPIGGVLATQGTVIPYAVGVDIACRMKLTVLDLPVTMLDEPAGAMRLEQSLLSETAFGTGAALDRRADDEVLDLERWASPFLRHLRDRAAKQLGSSGSGNHFVEFGELSLPADDLGLAAGSYLAVLSHSGSRGTGAAIAGHFSRLATAEHPELPRELRHLAWLDLDSDPGREYWEAMSLMGDYAAANHAVIHDRLRANLHASTLAGVENHHNYAWREKHGGQELIVHRKGATPAGAGVLGVIPGSMAAPGFVVRGRGVAESLDSAAHGAGRAMSRTAARERFTWKQVKPLLDQAGVTLLAAGIDENPLAYKDIHAVMARQADLVDVVARFTPRIVRMADGGERPED
jgi:tRNA-splicing ligase RtcB